jgi:acyl carrier protein
LRPEPSSARIPPADGTARRAWLIQTLAGLAPDFTGEIGDKTHLTEGGLGLDSLALIDLIAAMAECLEVTVLEHEITAENFASVGQLLRFLEARLD